MSVPTEYRTAGYRRRKAFIVFMAIVALAVLALSTIVAITN